MRGVLFLVLTCATLPAQNVFLEQISSDSAQGAILLPERRFREAELIRLASQYFSRHSQRTLVKVFIATAKEAAVEALTTSGAGERQYLTFAIQYLRPGWASWGMAEAIRIGQNAVLRIRYPDERIDRVVLQGSDPLLLGPDSEVIHVFLPSPGGPPPQTPPVFFVRTEKPLSEATCNRIVSELQVRTGLLEADVRVRNDRWFIVSPEMPVRYQFWQWQQVPGPVEFIEGRTALCGWDAGGRMKAPQIIYWTRKPKYCETP